MVHKYNAKKVSEDGYTFDSKAEHAQYQDLKYRQMAGEIWNLEVHPKYSIDLNDTHICTVILDFRYKTSCGTIVEDVKGMDTAISRLKRKMVEAQHGIKVEVIKRRA